MQDSGVKDYSFTTDKIRDHMISYCVDLNVILVETFQLSQDSRGLRTCAEK